MFCISHYISVLHFTRKIPILHMETTPSPPPVIVIFDIVRHVLQVDVFNWKICLTEGQVLLEGISCWRACLIGAHV